MNLPYVLLTAITVSADSFVAGFSLALNKRKSLFLPATVAVVTYALCLVASWAGSWLRPLLTNYVKYIGAAIFLGLGICNLLKKDTDVLCEKSATCFAIGFGVGLDGGAATLSLVIQGIDGTYLPLLFAVTHFITVFAGQSLAQFAKPKHTNVFSAVMFFVLAIVKLCDF